MPTVNVGSVSISYGLHTPPSSVTKTPTPTYVVLINGLADPKETWSLQIPPLIAGGFTVLIFDNRGIGSSSSPAGPYGAALLAGDAKSLVTFLKIPKFHLMGVSMGGMYVSRIVSDHVFLLGVLRLHWKSSRRDASPWRDPPPKEIFIAILLVEQSGSTSLN